MKGDSMMFEQRALTKQEERRRAKSPETSTFLWYNANPKGHITSDCTIRALSTGLGISWYDVLDGLYQLRRRYALYGDMKSIEKYLESQGWVKHKQPRRPDGKKYTGGQFANWLSVNHGSGILGPVICSVASHMFCIYPTNHGDGTNCKYKVLDTWDSTGKCICHYWTRADVDVPMEQRVPFGT